MEVCKRKMNLRIPLNLKGRESEIRINYDRYSPDINEIIRFFLEGLLIDGLIAYVFFRSWLAFIILVPIVYAYFKLKISKCIKDRKILLSIQFREMMNSIVAGLHAGYSIENAFIRSRQDMIMLFGKESLISMELKIMISGIKNNQNIENVLMDFANRTGIQDIQDFSQVFMIAKRSGGNIVENLKQTAEIISDKMDVRRKIDTLISSKKMEQSIMNVVPFGIILYIDMTSPGFFDALYHNFTGVLVMTCMLAIYLFAFYLAKKITDIEV